MASRAARPPVAGDPTPPSGLRVLRRSGARIGAVQVFGERCSGTHFLVRTIERSFWDAPPTAAHGFKHWFVPQQVAIPAGVLVVVIARHPHDWVRSLYAKPWHVVPHARRLPFGAFLRAEWHAVWDDANLGVREGHPLWGGEMLHERCPATGRRFANPLRLRSAKLAHWAGLAARVPDIALLAYEAVRDRPRAVLNGLRASFGLPAVAVEPVRSYKGQRLRAFAPSAYAPLAEADRAFIEAELDWPVEAFWGYRADGDGQG